MPMMIKPYGKFSFRALRFPNKFGKSLLPSFSQVFHFSKPLLSNSDTLEMPNAFIYYHTGRSSSSNVNSSVNDITISTAVSEQNLNSATGSNGTNNIHPTASMPTYSPPRIGIQTAKYSINLSKLAMDGKLDPVIGRAMEVDRAMQILARRTKNNPCFIGEPGVGKTALAEELARRIFRRDVPEFFRNKVILTLDLPSMLAGTKFRGEFEERFKGVLKEIEQSGDRIILFIDELHILTGAGGSEGAIDASNILKPSLSRGQIRCIGATTTDEYRKHIEKDAALARRFQAIYVSEPTVEMTKEILLGLKEKFELFHNILITEEAIDAAVSLSAKYITDRKFPDKAIDLLDEGSSCLKIKIDHPPSISQGDSSNHNHNAYLSNDDRGNQKWSTYKHRLSEVFNIKAKISELKLEEEHNRKSGNFERVNFIENVEMKEKLDLLNQYDLLLQDSLNDIYNHFKDTDLLKQRGREPHTLRGLDIASIITRQTGIPVGSLLADEKKSLLNMEVELNGRVIGQKEAIQAISKCIRLSRAGLRYHDRPLGVFLMIGGTGVGKTEVAKALSEYLFHDINATHLLRIDMSEYMERFSVSRLIGAPPGYVGYDEGGTLTESVRRRPFQVILLDEFEKAHRDVSNLLLQVFDEGRLSDSQGRVVDFRNAVIIMTSNLNSRDLIEIPDISEKTSKARKMLSDYFAPEFVNRLDDVIVFNPLSEETIITICNIQLEKVKKLLKERKIAVEFHHSLVQWIGKTGYDPNYGARPMKRMIQSKILDPLATLILEDKIIGGDKVIICLSEEVDVNSVKYKCLHTEPGNGDTSIKFLV